MVFARPSPCTRKLGPDFVPAVVGVNLGAANVDAGGSALDRSSLLALALPTPRLPRRASTTRAAGVASVVLHLMVVTALVLAANSYKPEPASQEASSQQPVELPRLVFFQMPGATSGGGGGGGSRQAAPSRAESIGRDRLTLQVAKPVIASERPKDETPPLQQVVLDAKPLSSGTTSLMGLPEAPSLLPFSLGSGFGEGVGEGAGTGIGLGTGSGLGPGSGGGFGGGAYRLGGGVVPPTLLKDVKPKYTAEALRQKIQGFVMLEVVVGRDGTPLAIRVARSLDPGGLDEEAITAVRQWRFRPGRVGETPVDVLVTVVLDFRIY